MGEARTVAALVVVAILIASEVRVSLAARRAGGSARVVDAELPVGTVVLLGSLTQPTAIYFDWARCMSLPESAGGSGVADALVWWNVFSEWRTVCDAVHFFPSRDCTGEPADKQTFTGFMSVTKMAPSVKSIRCVLGNICEHAKCPAHSTCIKTSDHREVGCECSKGGDEFNGCKPK
ncbi:hypothetical protein CLOM_g3325 [Closterium sp. NIES-68]|nr:hypothetical protein CLOM_g10670 [Closterium sp. NIES-68]GJP43924.1 hypothetical protein CLOM_g3325 [Closterium sp. NIES-68]GJP85775.1 hypothetical protein CLOP_g15874 [Closterium sp. NIES-67]